MADQKKEFVERFELIERESEGGEGQENAKEKRSRSWYRKRDVVGKRRRKVETLILEEELVPDTARASSSPRASASLFVHIITQRPIEAYGRTLFSIKSWNMRHFVSKRFICTFRCSTAMPSLGFPRRWVFLQARSPGEQKKKKFATLPRTTVKAVHLPYLNGRSTNSIRWTPIESLAKARHYRALPVIRRSFVICDLTENESYWTVSP